MTSSPALDPDGLGQLLWDSRTMVVAAIGPDLEILGVSPHLAAIMGHDMAGEPATALVSPGQAQALSAALQHAGWDWSDLVVGLAGGADDVPLDYRIRIAARGDGILLVGEPSIMDTSMVDQQLLEVTEDLISEQRRITIDRDRLDRLTTTDPLTNVGNRRRLEVDLAQRIAAASAGEPVSVVFADIDHFKVINDEFGHAVGDDVLRFVSDLLGATCRGDDVVARYGGEEFVAVLPRTDLDGAARWAERARSTLAAVRAPDLGRSVTASFGVAEHRRGETADDLLARADVALYAAKAAGRDRVALAAALDAASPIVVDRRTEAGLDLIVDVDADLPGTTEAPVMGLVDDLVQAQRELTHTNQRLQRTLDDLEAASQVVRRLRGIVPNCAWCHRIRVEGSGEPEWLSTDEFLGRDQVAVSHGICDDCMAREQQ